MKARLSLISPLCALALASCSTLNQGIEIASIDPALPVSASSSLYVDGELIEEGEYREIAPISIVKTFRAPLKQEKNVVDIEAELKEAVAREGGDAVAKLKVTIDDFDAKDYAWVYLERTLGANMAISGGIVLIFVGADSSDVEDPEMVLIAAGSTCAGGLALLGISLIHEKLGHATYTIGLDGVVIKLPPR